MNDEPAGMTPEERRTRTAYYNAGYAVIAFFRGWDVTPPASVDLDSLRQHLTSVIAGNLSALKGCRDSDPDLQGIAVPLYALKVSREHGLPAAETRHLAEKIFTEVEALLNRDAVWTLVAATAYQLLGQPILSEKELAELGKQLERLQP